ncbi:hypothetical protein HNP37_001437 [Flavobacterium nitrogenifigens]|uniref:Uncharacterized protein n=2 Tax=Flavobacterium TaxID=237 RepID=A0A7W7N7G8_9FLAO|nr:MULTISPECIES: hypothetical protein [Flavobacterium]MBB4801376.1 hypothetical protein [Flavobacterium nitrogenifigens]MBB6386333.1 hypothetical protein [Flavobacterium notoginsengisoli]
MKKLILRVIIVFMLFTFIPIFYSFGIHKAEQENHKILYIKDLNPKSFITLCKERHNKTPINSVSMAGEFPDNWVKQNDVQYLISIMHSKEKCCGYMNILSSHISKDDAEVGGFAIIFLNSYINKTKINLGLNSYPKTDKESIKKIENWYKKTAK